MGIFGNIVSKIFHSESAGAPGYQVPSVPTPLLQPGVNSPTGQSKQAQSVDVAAVLSGLAQKSGQKLNWKESIVDLLKVLDLDSSLTARKGLAQELHYNGDTNDSAQMNIWLQKQVMQKLAENGGKVPPELLN